MIAKRSVIVIAAILGVAAIAIGARAQLQGVLLAPQQATGAITATPVLTINGSVMTINGSVVVK